MKKRMMKNCLNNPSERITKALRKIRFLAQEIADTAADPSRKLSDLFTEGAIQAKTNACIELALAVADCNRPKWLREVRSEIERTQYAVIAADNALAPCMTLNPEMMNHFLGAEQKVFDMMLSSSLKVLALAKFARMMRAQLMTYLHKECVSIRIELLHWESAGGGIGIGDSGLGNSTKIAAPDLADAADCKRFISELAETIEREYKSKIHNHGQAVDYILTGAKSCDLFFEDCKIARQIRTDRNWERSTFFNYSKPKHLPKPKNLRKAARKRATQKKTWEELKRLVG